jgi:type II secretory pathway component PulF
MARTLELLLRSGIPLIKAIRIVVPVVTNQALRRELDGCRMALEQGGFLSDSLKKARYFPPFVCYFVGIGEESGRLDETLHEIADWYEKDTMEAVKIMMSLLEPCLILVIGSILGFIIMAVLLPVFSINTMAV